MTEIRTIKPVGEGRPSLPMTLAYLLAGSAFLAAPAVYAGLHEQRLPPLFDMIATVAVGGVLVAYSLLSLKRAIVR